MFSVPILSQFAPAKLNLFLAVTGRRPDGYHELVSVAAPLDLGDTLRAEPVPGGFTLECDDVMVPRDETNLILKAARAFSAATGWSSGVRFLLEKRIPMGAGLGGGSSDGVAALRALNILAGNPLSAPGLAAIAAQLGSDCPLFLHAGPVVMRGRGERVALLSAPAAAALHGRKVLVFKPDFGVTTAWAYARLAAMGSEGYLPVADAEARLAAWLTRLEAAGRPSDRATAELLFNNMEAAAFAKFLALPAMLERLRTDFGLAPRMSGSGSACYAFLTDDTPVDAIVVAIRAAWGAETFVMQARLA